MNGLGRNVGTAWYDEGYLVYEYEKNGRFGFKNKITPHVRVKVKNMHSMSTLHPLCHLPRH